MGTKEKKELLTSFNKIEGRVKELEAELEVLWSIATNISPNISGMPGASGGFDKMVRSIEKMEELVKLIDAERDELEVVKLKIMTAIKGLDDITERRILHLKYIGQADGQYHDTMPLWKIANRLGYSLDRVKHKHSDAIAHLKL